MSQHTRKLNAPLHPPQCLCISPMDIYPIHLINPNKCFRCLHLSDVSECKLNRAALSMDSRCTYGRESLISTTRHSTRAAPFSSRSDAASLMEVRDCKHFLPFSEHETDKILIFSLESYFVQEKNPYFPAHHFVPRVNNGHVRN